jgi:hypothetical protein
MLAQWSDIGNHIAPDPFLEIGTHERVSVVGRQLLEIHSPQHPMPAFTW